MRKGKVVHEERMGNVENCAYALALVLMRAKDDALGYYGGGEDGTCDQEGCAEQATVTYRMKQEFCNKTYSSGHQPIDLNDEIVIRQFCARHSTRGDCAFEDADKNYEIISGITTPPQGSDESPSAFGGVVVI